ncbi:hypothetical protein [Streptomyces xantholiticus]|uniref:hypothetical protein n=1 Tax=Streptomyces xantholiticus TaxID=68285 RepID=UPI001673BE7C|nr:hypothetical protein [Streptomyces xantholiticus]GGW42414.1 hypothetical protein GCM10010381_29350 [Streptomyces xantholiticus]
MHGHGFAPPQPRRPSTALLVVVRIVFVALALLSFGLLAWGTMLRIAIMRGRRSDWLLFWLSLAIVVTCLVVIGEFSSEGETPAADAPPRPVDYVCLLAMLGLALGVPTHYLVADIRHYQEPQTAAAWPPPLPTGSPYGPAAATGGPYGMPRQQSAGYGYPPAQPPAQVGPAQPQVQAPSGRPPAPPIPTPAPSSPPASAPAIGRIDQVRAELDELSDLLRKEEDK